jgi:hypothetical protein
MPTAVLQIVRGIGYAASLILPSWLLFGPVAAFHHMVRCGLLCPVFLDGEMPRSGVPRFLGEYDVHVFPGRLGISILLWFACVFLLFRFVKAVTRIVEPGTAPNGGPATQLGNSDVTEGPPSVS